MSLRQEDLKPSPAWEAWRRERKTRGELSFPTTDTPGVGEYEVKELRSTPRRYRKKQMASFASTTKRDSFLVNPELIKNPNFTKYHPERADKLQDKQHNLFLASFKNKSERNIFRPNDVPGPLTYEEVRDGAISAKRQGASFGSVGDRFQLGKSFIPLSLTPGPGAYAPEIPNTSLQRVKTAPLSRRGGHWDMDIARIAAGPGSSMKSPVARPDNFITADRASLPGPNAYSPKRMVKESYRLNTTLSFMS